MASKLEATKPKDDADAVTNSGKPATKGVVTKLSNSVQTIDKKMSSLRGEKGALIKSASDDDNVDKQAFSAAMKELGMDPERRAEYQRNLGRYRDYLGIQLQGDLLKDSKPGAARA